MPDTDHTDDPSDANADEIFPKPRPARQAKHAQSRLEPTSDGKTPVSTDDYALVVASKAAGIVEERRKTTIRVIVAGMVTIIGVVSYLGLSNLRGLIIEEVRTQVQPLQESFATSSNANRVAVQDGLDSFAQKLELSNLSASLAAQQSLAQLEGRMKSEISSFVGALDSLRESIKQLEARLGGVDAEARSRTDELRGMSESGLAEIRSSMDGFSQHLTFLALDILVRELDQKDHITAKQRDSMVSSVIALASARTALETDEYAKAAATVIKNLSSANQNSQVDEIDRALWPHLEALLANSMEAESRSRLARWSNYFTETSRHYGRLLLGGDDDQGVAGSPVDTCFFRYASACTAARYPESSLALEISVAVKRQGGRSDQALRTWDKILDLTDGEKRYVILDLIEKTDELAWRTEPTTLGKRIERVTRLVWTSFSAELHTILQDPGVVASIRETIVAVPPGARVRAMVERALALKNPWEA
jgi:hypothetical protein